MCPKLARSRLREKKAQSHGEDDGGEEAEVANEEMIN